MLTALGNWSYRHRRWVMAGWALLFAVGIVIGSQVLNQLKDSAGGGGSEAAKGYHLLKDSNPHGPVAIALISGPALTDPATRAAVLQAKARIEQLPNVTDVTTAYDSDDPHLRSSDGRASLMLITVTKAPSSDPMAAHRSVGVIRGLLHGSVPGASVQVGGDLAFERDVMNQTSKDLLMGEAVALPLLLIALVFVFRSVRLALIPVAGALVTIAGAMLLLLAATKVMDVGSYAIDVVTLFGLALAVDYSLLMANRFREQRAAGADSLQATVGTTAAAGRTITFSALTVIASLSGLFVFGDPTFTSLAIGGIATVLIALFASLTLVPALLAVCAHHIGAQRAQTTGAGFFAGLAHRVQRRPVLVVVTTTSILIALAIPFLGVALSDGDPRVLPRSAESRQVADQLADSFPGKQADPVIIAGTVPATDPAVTSYAEQIKQFSGVADVSIATDLRGGVSAIEVVPNGSVQGDVAQHLVTQLREHRPSYPSYVTGQAAGLADFKHHISTRLPYAIGLIALATFVLLFLMTGSILVPAKALIMNMVSLGATFGALVWIFQDGHLSGLLGFQAYGAIEVWVPIVVFVFSFGLSMDYEVFLLGRIKESYDESGDSASAVANGLQRSGRIITSAAALVLIVFLGFASGRSLGIKEMGLALAIAVVVDTTLVRCLLVPATMTLLGERNWWAPAPLRRLHDRYGLREAPPLNDVPEAPIAADRSTVPFDGAAVS